MIIRKAQMDALNALLIRAFERSVYDDISERFPRRFAELGGNRVRQLIGAGLRKAGKYGIASEDDAARLIEVMLEYGENFEELPELEWPCRCLSDASLTGDLKVGILVGRLRARKRHSVAAAAAAGAG